MGKGTHTHDFAYEGADSAGVGASPAEDIFSSFRPKAAVIVNSAVSWFSSNGGFSALK